jgi:O-antigen ligase
MKHETQARSADTLRGTLLCAAIVLSAVAYSFRLTSFLHAKEAVLALFLVVMAVIVALRGNVSIEGFRAFSPLWAYLILSGIASLVVFPARVLSDTVVELVRCGILLTVTACVYGVLHERPWRERVTGALLGSMALVAVLGLLQYAGVLSFLFPAFPAYGQRVYSVFGNQDLFGGYLAIGIPLAVRRTLTRAPFRPSDLVLVAILLAGLMISGSRSAWLAMAAGVLVSIPHRHVTRPGVAALGGTCALIILMAVWLAPEATYRRVVTTFSPEDQGGRLRLWFWDGTLRMIRDAPIVGMGLGNYAYWSPRYLGDALHAPGGRNLAHNELHTEHAHSEPLQILAETGLVGTCCWVWMLMRALRCRGPEWGGLTALLVFSLFNAGFHSAPHALAGLLLVGMLSADGYPPTRLAKSPLAAYGFAGCALLMAAFFVWAVLIPSCRLRTAEDLHLAGKDCLGQYQKVIRYPWPNARGHEEYAIALLHAGRSELAYHEFQRALEGLDTGSVYLGLATLARSCGDEPRRQQWIDACFHRWPSSPMLWELIFRESPPHEQARVREEASQWNVSLAARGESRDCTPSSF